MALGISCIWLFFILFIRLIRLCRPYMQHVSQGHVIVGGVYSTLLPGPVDWPCDPVPFAVTARIQKTEDLQIKTENTKLRLRKMIQVRYRKNPHMQNSVRKLKLKLTLVLTLTDTGGTVLTLMLGYRSLYIT